MNVIVVDFDETLCPSHMMKWDDDTRSVVLADAKDGKKDAIEGRKQVLEMLDDANVALLLECQKCADVVCILSNGTSLWVYGAMQAFLPRTLGMCLHQNISIVNGPDLFHKTTDCPLAMKRLGMAAICDPFAGRIQVLMSIGDDLPEYLACINYAKLHCIPKCRTFMIEKTNPPNVAAHIEMLRFLKSGLTSYAFDDPRPTVHVTVAYRYPAAAD